MRRGPPLSFALLPHQQKETQSVCINGPQKCQHTYPTFSSFSLPRTETFAFGSNSHYNLGLDIGPNTQTPKCIEFFRRNNISIKYVALSGFHSLFLSITDDVYAVGHGIGGRLGHGQETTVVQPQKLNLRLKRTDEKIISFSASKNHSLILSNISNVSMLKL